MSMEQGNESEFTKDGSVDVFGNPARRKRTGGWKSASFFLGYEALATITYLGVETNLVLYLIQSLQLSNGAAANAATNWVGTSYATSLIGAFLGDAYLGRSWASVLFVTIHFLGALLLTVQASFKVHSCKASEAQCTPPSKGQKAFLYVALYIFALGAGGHQPCMSALGADQFDDEYAPEKLQKAAYFSYFFVSSLLGSLFVTVVLSYIEVRHSYTIGFAVATATIGVAGFLFVAGTRYYRYFKPGGNPLARALQVIVAVIRNWSITVPSDTSLLYENTPAGKRRILHSNRLRFLDKAATITDAHRIDPTDKISHWRLCTVTQVEEVKCVALMTPLWISTCIYQMVAAQVSTTFVEQGASMDTSLGVLNVSPASLYTFYTLAVVVGAVLYERYLVPAVRRLTKNERGLTILQKMGVGHFIMVLVMAVAAFLETRRLQLVKGHQPVHMTVFWQVPQYVLGGLAELFSYVAQTEFFYDQVPDGVRGLGSALSMSSVAVGNYLSTLTVTIVNKRTRTGDLPGWLPMDLNQGRLDLFFLMMTVISAVNFVYYLICARGYKYIDVEVREE